MGLGLSEIAILLCIGMLVLVVVGVCVYFIFIKKKE